ncbi:MAG TPA: redox-regulated ATPase YchF [Chitinivibrionales bacterium]|jgi:GTP-binding protein YchF|nr:redox-regulated ATPase YchF [Chitinivibrionales bacterium]
MGLSAGIVGLPNVGKSTLFNALCNGKAQVENYPFTTIDPNTGVVAVPDDRLDRITRLSPTQKVVPAFLELLDIAGLVKGASKGEGLGNQFLGHIKNVNAIVHVARCFEDENVVHVEGSVDPVRDVGLVDTELMLADLGTVERGIARVEKAAKSGDKELKEQLAAFQKAFDALSAGAAARKLALTHEELAALAELNLLTAKPVLYVANVDEDSVLSDNAAAAALRKHAEAEGSDMVRICAKIEAEIADLPQEERPEFLAGLGLDKSGLALLAQAAYRLLGLETFFTATEKENRAWTVRKGAIAAKAAGAIHSDFEKGFIRAEVFTLGDLEHYKSEVAIRAAGKVRSEGKDYIVQDGDIIFFRFNV